MTENSKVLKASKAGISVIIPMYNAAETIRYCLESVFASAGVSYEVIVVNDTSTDNSLAIALEFPCKVISLESNIMAANCRNLGARHAESDILIFFDSDQVMRPDTLQRFVIALQENPDFDAVVGSFEADTPRSGFFSKFKNLRHHYVHQTAKAEGCTLASGLTAIRKNTFDVNGGFEPAYQSASIEDIALGYKMRRNNHRILFRADIQMLHLKGYSFTELLLSDILNRAIPWTQIMVRDRIWKNDLNMKIANTACVALAWLIPLVLIMFDIQNGAIIAATCVILIWILNAGLLRAAVDHFGIPFLANSLLFTPFMYFYQGIGAMAALVCYASGRSVIGQRPSANVKYEILQGESGHKA